jgi:pimeloyl-ACP methyl ester carboxylesterase
MCAVVNWRPSPGVARVRVFHVHGSEDRVLPVALAKPDVVVPGGSHALPLFHATAVNEFIAKVVRTLASSGG